MTESFGWHLLAGFMIGLGVSTLWEWLYFRRKRMVIRDRRISELEATLRTYATAAGSSQANDAATDDWGEPHFENPLVYLETEEPAPVARQPDELPPSTSPQSVRAPAYVSADANGAPLPSGAETNQPSTQPVDALPAQAKATQSAGFQSVAVQQTTPTGGGAPPPGSTPVLSEAEQPDQVQLSPAEQGQESTGERRLSPAKAAAVIGAATAVKHADREDSVSHDDPGDDTASAVVAPDSTPSAEAVSLGPIPTGEEQAAHYANGHASSSAYAEEENLSESEHEKVKQAVYAQALGDTLRSPGETLNVAPAAGKPITSGELDALAASINDLIETVNKEPAKSEASSGRAGAIPSRTPDDGIYTTKITGRTEFILVRLVQTLVQFVRQVRSIVTGEGAEKPAVYTADNVTAEDDITKIEGLTQAHAERLRIGGVTTFAQIATLSTDELRLMTVIPGAGAADYERWRAEAAYLAASSQEVSLQ